MTVDSWDEEYTFLCRRCGHEWTAKYEVRRYQGSGHDEWIVYWRGGRLVRPPRMDATCPRCGGLRVKLLPRRSGEPKGPLAPRPTQA